jgi:hypothetical protein
MARYPLVTEHANQLWIAVQRQKADGSVTREMLVIGRPWKGNVRMRLDHPSGSSVEYVLAEQDAQEIARFLDPRGHLQLVPE